MKIDEKTNIVIALFDENNAIYAYCHSTPISTEVFDLNWQLLGKTYSELMDTVGMDSLHLVGPKVAVSALRDAAGKLFGDAGIGKADALLAEVRRLSTIIVSQENGGYQPVPYSAATSREMITASDAREVESVIVFFTLGWHLFPNHLRAQMWVMIRAWSGQTSSLSPSAFISSLRELKDKETTGENTAAQ